MRHKWQTKTPRFPMSMSHVIRSRETGTHKREYILSRSVSSTKCIANRILCATVKVFCCNIVSFEFFLSFYWKRIETTKVAAGNKQQTEHRRCRRRRHRIQKWRWNEHIIGANTNGSDVTFHAVLIFWRVSGFQPKLPPPAWNSNNVYSRREVAELCSLSICCTRRPTNLTFIPKYFHQKCQTRMGPNKFRPRGRRRWTQMAKIKRNETIFVGIFTLYVRRTISFLDNRRNALNTVIVSRKRMLTVNVHSCYVPVNRRSNVIPRNERNIIWAI